MIGTEEKAGRVYSIGEAAVAIGVSYFKLNRLIGLGRVVQPLRTQAGTRRFYSADQVEEIRQQIDALSASVPARNKASTGDPGVESE